MDEDRLRERGPGDDALAWLAAEARDLERRVVALLEAARRLAEERLETARAAAEMIVNAALREAEEIRRAAREDAGRAGGGPPPPVSAPAPPPRRARVFVGGEDVEEARRVAGELLLGGLGRARIAAELASRYPAMSRERIDSIVASLLIPPAPVAGEEERGDEEQAGQGS